MSKKTGRPGALVFASILAGVGCGGDDDDGEETTLFADDYDTTFTEVRDCRKSADHDLNNIRILTDPTALAAYEERTEEFPDGSIVIKEEYDFADETCSGDIIQWTVMVKGDADSNADTLGWHWQQVSGSRKVETDNEFRCINCHTECGVPPGGFQGTCAEPPPVLPGGVASGLPAGPPKGPPPVLPGGVASGLPAGPPKGPPPVLPGGVASGLPAGPPKGPPPVLPGGVASGLPAGPPKGP